MTSMAPTPTLSKMHFWTWKTEQSLGGPNGLLPLAHQNRAVTEGFGKSEIPGPNISVICPGSCPVAEIQITSCPSEKEFSTLSISVICTGVVPAQK